MSLIIQCPQCNHSLNASEQAIGRRVSCPNCKHQFVLSAPANTANAVEEGGGPAGANPPYYQQPLPRLPTSGFAIASLVLGIISIPTCVLYGVPSLVCGILAIIFAKTATRDIATGVVSPASTGMASAGKICGWVGLGIAIAFWGTMIVVFIIMAATGNLE